MVVEDHPAHLHLLRTIFDLDDDFRVVGVASDGIQGLDAARKCRPDLVLIEMHLALLEGGSLVPLFRRLAPCAVVAFMSDQRAEEAKPRAEAAGADVYVDKGLGVHSLMARLRHAVRVRHSGT